MINKNFYRKTNDKKILHKVGKQWKVISVALLMAIGGGAAIATHANANADSTDGVNTTPYAANQAQFKQPTVTPKPQKQQKAPASVGYYPANSGSAAYYFDRVASDNNVANKNRNAVNSYVQSLNAEYNPEISSYAAKSNSASAAANNDSKLAQSYSNTTKNSNVSSAVNSLAAKNHMDPTLYQGMIQGQEQAFSGDVKSASADVNAASMVNSLVNSLQGADLNVASQSVSGASVTAQSNYIAASDNYDSVLAHFGNGNTVPASYINIANQLRSDAKGLVAAGNPVGQGAEYGLLTDVGAGGYNTAEDKAALNSAITSDANIVANQYKVAYSAELTNPDANGYPTSLSEFANGIDNANSAANNPYVADDEFGNTTAPLNIVAGANANDSYFNNAISEAANEQFATTLESAANSLDGTYHAQYNNSLALSGEKSSAEKSASAELRAASFAYDEAQANSYAVDSVSADVESASDNTALSLKNENDAKAYVANSYLSEGVTTFANNLASDADYFADNGIGNFAYQYNYPNVETINNVGSINESYNNDEYNGRDANGEYIPALVHALGNSNNAANTLLNNINSDANLVGSNLQDFLGIIPGATTPAKVQHNISSAVTVLNNAAQALNDANSSHISTALSTRYPGIHTNTNLYTGGNRYVTIWGTHNGLIATLAKGNTLATYALVAGLGDETNQKLSDVANGISNVADNLSTIANAAGSITGEPNQTNGMSTQTGQNEWVPNSAAHELMRAALLSDGVDMAKLSAASGAIGNVYANENSAATTSVSIENESSAEKLNDALSVAASSANSALGSAKNQSASDSSANDENVTLASYFANSYSNEANSESADAATTSTGLNNFLKSMANDPTFNSVDDAFADAESAAASDKKLGEDYSAVVYNNSPHFLDVLKGAKMHSSYNFGSNGDKIVGNVNKGDRLTVIGVNFNRNGLMHGATRYLVYDNNTKQKGFFTGQPQYSKAAYLNSVYNTNNVDVSVKTLKPVNVMSEINGGKVVKTLKAGTIVDGVTIVNDNPSNDAMGFTKVETSDYNFFTANTDYVELNNVVPKNTSNNTPQPSNINLSGDVNLGDAYNNFGQVK